ncbi:MAG: patatin-like phospholipase family protein [Chloroflexi bacterium]|nr:patatin-like phospholipase family protein [Chloroflexota bacterium]
MLNQGSLYDARPSEVGLALSGGGFRATLFHLGAAWRLNELGLLRAIDRISSVSGGSLLAGLLAIRWSSLDFGEGVASNFCREVVEPIWNLCGRNIDVWATVRSLMMRSNALPYFYRKHLVGDHTLQDMPDAPEFLFNAAHLETGRNWTFSKAAMRTYMLGIVEKPNVYLANVLAASSALPPVFPPMILRLDPDVFRRSEYARLFDRVDLKRRVSLLDGGVYDNLGVQPISRFGTLLVSDASGPLESEIGGAPLRTLFHRTMRPIAIAVEQTRALRRRDTLRQLENGERQGAWWAVGTRTQAYPVKSPFEVAEGWTALLESTRTRLNSFSDEEKARMINWGYLQCDLSVRSHYRKEASPPISLPYPEYSFDRDPSEAVR